MFEPIRKSHADQAQNARQTEHLPVTAGDTPEYRAPQLLQVGTLSALQGRNYYDDRDAGNSYFYI